MRVALLPAAVSLMTGCTVISGVTDLPDGRHDGSGGNVAMGAGGGTGGSMGGTGGAGGEGGGTGGGASTLDCADADLLACFPFDTDFEDASSNQPPASVSGAVRVPGVAGQALGVDGSSYVGFKPTFTAGIMTLEMWVRADVLPTSRAGLIDDDSSFSLFLNSDGSVQVDTQGGRVSGGSVVVGAWTHLAGIWDGTLVRLYQDGVLVGEIAGADEGKMTAAVLVGAEAPKGAKGLVGAIDSLRIFDVARSAAQICEAAACDR